MSDQFNWNDFSAGWIPSDDAVNGRKNGLLRMDNLELDKNGALSLSGGCTPEGSAYTYNAHSLFSNIISGTRYDYVGDTNGGILRNGSSIGTGGDATNMAAGVAFNYTLLASGNKRLKDNGSVAVPLGIDSNVEGISILAVDGQYVNPTQVNSLTAYSPASTSDPTYVSGPFIGLWGLPSVTGYLGGLVGVGQTVTLATPGPIDTTSFHSVGQIGGDPSSPLPGAPNYSQISSNDVVYLQCVESGISGVVSITLDFLLAAGDGSGDVVSDYFTQTWVNDGESNPNISIPFIRGDGITTGFQRIGSGIQGWQNVYGFRITIVYSSSFSPTGAVVNVIPTFNFYGAAHSLQGTYQFAQVNVNNTGSYVAKAQLGAVSGSLTFNNQLCQIKPYNPTLDDSQCNEAWIFARGGLLDQWYRIAVFTASGIGFSTKNWSSLSDLDMLALDITVNLNLVSIASTGISDKIFDIVGPMEGRWFYFTTNFIYPSDINDPDLVDVSLAVRSTGANSEIFLWARRVANQSILVGTSRDVYLLTGTFVTLPDGTVDIYYQSLGCKYPPISYDATFSEGFVMYLSANGWRSIDTSGANPSLTNTNTDRLYRGITCYGYSVNTQVIAGSTRFPCVLALNRLWCGITGQARIEVLDTIRSYWRSFSLGKGDCTAICSTQDGKVLAFFASDKKLRVLDVQSNLAIDGSTNQTVNILSPVFDGGTPRQRKDLYTLKIRANTGGQTLTVSITDDTNTTTSLGTVTTSSLTETNLDISQFVALSKWLQISATGAFSNLTIDDFSIHYDTRPIPLTFTRIYNQNFGNSCKKRLRVWPAMLDARGGSVTFTPFNDNSAGTPVALTSSEKTTLNVFYKSDVFAIDYGATLYSSTPFEFWGMMNPDIVQVLPIARQFDQVGPEELFRYGWIKELELRVLAFGTTIPFTIYFNDNSTGQGNLTVKNGFEETYTIPLPKGNSGEIVRIVFGPTVFNFHRYYVRLKCSKSGRDTDLTWVTIPDPSAGEGG